MREKFIQISKIHQEAALTKRDAINAFNISCNICCSRGIKMDCDRCEVKNYHELIVAVFEDLESIKKQKMSIK